MSVGLTGATGALGRRILEALEGQGVEVTAFPGDVRSASELDRWADGLDVLVHCAAVVPTHEVMKYLAEAIDINVAGTANVARAAKASGCRLTYISTSHVYRSSADPLDEGGPLAPISMYGLTKLQGEQWVGQLCPDALILRVFSFFDARQAGSFLVPALIRRVMDAPQGATLDLLGGDSRRDIADATWLAAASTRLIAAGASGVVNCAAGRRDSVADIATAVAHALDRRDISWRVVQDRPPDFLLANVDRMRSLAGSLPPFDLNDAVIAASRSLAPRSEDALRSRLETRP